MPLVPHETCNLIDVKMVISPFSPKACTCMANIFVSFYLKLYHDPFIIRLHLLSSSSSLAITLLVNSPLFHMSTAIYSAIICHLPEVAEE